MSLAMAYHDRIVAGSVRYPTWPFWIFSPKLHFWNSAFCDQKYCVWQSPVLQCSQRHRGLFFSLGTSIFQLTAHRVYITELHRYTVPVYIINICELVSRVLPYNSDLARDWTRSPRPIMDEVMGTSSNHMQSHGHDSYGSTCKTSIYRHVFILVLRPFPPFPVF